MMYRAIYEDTHEIVESDDLRTLIDNVCSDLRYQKNYMIGDEEHLQSKVYIQKACEFGCWGHIGMFFMDSYSNPAFQFLSGVVLVSDGKRCKWSEEV